MRPESHYESWKRRRSASDVPQGFDDRVMSTLGRSLEVRRWAGLERFLAPLLGSRLGKLGICALAGLALAFRMLSLIALFWPR